jgi:hypothetical protein
MCRDSDVTVHPYSLSDGCSHMSVTSFSVLSVLDQTGHVFRRRFSSNSLNFKNYSQLDREALAIIFGVKKFHKFLMGRKFILVTDHQPLASIFNPSKGISKFSAARLLRWSLILGAYDYDIKYKKGSLIANAVALSRLPIDVGSADEDSDKYILSISESDMLEMNYPTYVNIAIETKDDPVLSKVINFCQNGWSGYKEEEAINTCSYYISTMYKNAIFKKRHTVYYRMGAY